MPWLCASDSDAHICDMIRKTRLGGSRVTRSISARSDLPCRYSIAMKSSPSLVCPKSMSRTVFGWSSRDAARASLWKRLTHDGSVDTCAPNTLMAMVRSTESCLAR